MCDPVSMALTAVPMIIGGAGTMMGASGKLKAGLVDAEAARHQLGQFRFNAELLDAQADVVDASRALPWLRANVAETKVRDEGEAVLAGQNAYFASALVDPAYGSPLLIQATTAGRVQSDVDQIRAGAAIEEATIATQAANIRAQVGGQHASGLGAAYKMEGAAMGAQYGAATEMLSGAAKMWPGISSGISGIRAELPSASFLMNGMSWG